MQSFASTVSETCLWLSEGYRRICITYYYECGNGRLMYAASIYKCAFSDHTHRYIEPTQQEMGGNEHTTTRRFQIRPVTIIVAPFLSYEEILKAIRDEMCHGFGCKGPRTSTNIDCESVASSENSFVSNVSHEHFDEDYSPEEDVDIEALDSKKVRKIRYISTTTNENFNGK